MKYDFDRAVNRLGTDSFKYDHLEECVGPDRCDSGSSICAADSSLCAADSSLCAADSSLCAFGGLIPMWVADMDFETPPFIKRAIQKRAGQQVFGYTCCTDAYKQSIVDWCARQYGWEFGTECVNYIPGVVAGIFLAVHSLTEKGDRILIQDPVYHPFRIVPETSGRVIVRNSLTRTEDGFEMDFAALDHDLEGCKMMILCNPHNPGGVCWNRETLQKVAEICKAKNVIVVSDEIHCDMILDPSQKHIPYAAILPLNTITLQAPSKVFNMPGVVSAHAIVTDPQLREKYFSYIHQSDQDLGNIFAFDCTRACYTDEGDVWRREMLAYVQDNVNILCDGLASVSQYIKVIRPEASFLAFLDCRGLGLASASEYQDFFALRCGLALNEGSVFGHGGLGYMRMNLGCPHSTVQTAVQRILSALNQLPAK